MSVSRRRFALALAGLALLPLPLASQSPDLLEAQHDVLYGLPTKFFDALEIIRQRD